MTIARHHDAAIQATWELPNGLPQVVRVLVSSALYGSTSMCRHGYRDRHDENASRNSFGLLYHRGHHVLFPIVIRLAPHAVNPPWVCPRRLSPKWLVSQFSKFHSRAAEF